MCKDYEADADDVGCIHPRREWANDDLAVLAESAERFLRPLGK
jgi:hypothetical protein